VGTSNDADEYFFGGLEYELYNIAQLRVGHKGAQEADDNGFTFGGGLQYAGFKVNYAFVPFGELGDQQRFSFTYLFGEPTRTRAFASSEEDDGIPEASQKVVREKLRIVRDLYHDNKLKKAHDKLQVLRDMFPENTTVLLWLGVVVHERGDSQQALQLMRRVQQLDPDNSFARENIRRLQPLVQR
jgi:hypothetical protein